MKPYELKVQYINIITGEEFVETVSSHKSERAAKIARKRAANRFLTTDSFVITKVK